jgi:hypothetical protein
MDALKPTLEKWDDKDTKQLQRLYDQYFTQPHFIKYLTDWSIQDVSLQNASTWLLKYHLDQKHLYTRHETRQLLPALQAAQDWPAQLHLLQMLPKLALAQEDFQLLLPKIDQLIKSPNKFVKAWAYYALALSSHFVKELQAEVEGRFSLALSTESPAVKARIRKAVKDFNLHIKD